MPKSDRDGVRKKSYWPIVPMNRDTEILKKILAKIMQQNAKRKMHEA